MIIPAKRRHVAQHVPTSSLADIGFLLLIFFLVAASIDIDTGIGMTLPPVSNHEPPPIKTRNVLAVAISEDGRILVEQDLISVDALRAEVQRHVANCLPAYTYGCSDAYAEHPRKAVVSIKTAEGTPYADYIAAMDQIWLAYWALWDQEAVRLGYADYDAYRSSLMGRQAVDAVRAAFPPQISLAEPDQP